MVALLIAMPSLRLTLTEEIIPKQVDGFINLLDKKFHQNNNTETVNYWYN